MSNDLIERLETAEGPSRDLDAEIFVQVTPGVLDAGRIDCIGGLVGWWPRDAPYQSAREVPKYTSSLDAALTLIPDELTWYVDAGCFSCIWRVSDRKHFGARAASPTLALCAAALKARGADWQQTPPAS